MRFLSLSDVTPLLRIASSGGGAASLWRDRSLTANCASQIQNDYAAAPVRTLATIASAVFMERAMNARRYPPDQVAGRGRRASHWAAAGQLGQMDTFDKFDFEIRVVVGKSGKVARYWRRRRKTQNALT